MENDSVEAWVHGTYNQILASYRNQGVEITPAIQQQAWDEANAYALSKERSVNEDEGQYSDRVQLVVDYALNLDSDTIKNLDYDPVALAQYAADCCEDADLFDNDDDDDELSEEELAQVAQAIAAELPQRDLDEASDEDNFPFDSPYWTVHVSFPTSQISKKEMIAQQVEAIAQSRGGSVEMSSEPAPGYEGTSFGYAVAFEEGDVNTYGFITRIQKEMAGFNPTVDFDEEDVTYPSTDEANDKKRYQFSLEETEADFEVSPEDLDAASDTHDSIADGGWDAHVARNDAVAKTLSGDTEEEREATRAFIRRSIENPPYPTRYESVEELKSKYLAEAKVRYNNEKFNEISQKIEHAFVVNPTKLAEWLEGKVAAIMEDAATFGSDFITTVINVNGMQKAVKVTYTIIDGEPEPTSVVDAETNLPVVDNIEELEADDYDRIIDALYDSQDVDEEYEPQAVDMEPDVQVEPETSGDMEQSLETFVTGLSGENIPVTVKYTEIADSMDDDDDVADGTISVPEDIDLTKDYMPVSQTDVDAAQLPKSFTARNGKTYVISAIINLQTGEDILSAVTDSEINRIQSAVDDLESADFDDEEEPQDVPVNDYEPVAYDFIGGDEGGFAFESVIEHFAKLHPKKSLYGKSGLKAQLKEAIASLKAKNKVIEADNRIRIMPSHPDAVDTMEVPYEIWLGNMTVADVEYNDDGDFIIKFMPRFETPDVKIGGLNDIEHIIQTWAKEKGLMESEDVILKKKLIEYSTEDDILSSEAQELIDSYLKYEDGSKESDIMIDDIVGMLEDQMLPVDLKAIEKAVYSAFPNSFPLHCMVDEDNGMTAVADLVAQVSQDPNAKRQLDNELRKKQQELKKAQMTGNQNGQQDQEDNQNGNGQNGQQGNQNQQQNQQNKNVPNKQANGFSKPSGFTKPTGTQGTQGPEDTLNTAVQQIQKAIKTGGLKLKGMN